MMREYSQGGVGERDVKNSLIDAADTILEPFVTRRAQYTGREDQLFDLLIDGSRVVQEVVVETHDMIRSRLFRY